MPYTLKEAIAEIESVQSDLMRTLPSLLLHIGETERNEARGLMIDAFRNVEMVRRMIVTEAFDQDLLQQRPGTRPIVVLPTEGEASPARMRDVL